MKRTVNSLNPKFDEEKIPGQNPGVILVYGDDVICEGQLRTIRIILRVWGTGKPVNTITVVIIQDLLTSFSHARLGGVTS